ncbi:hypothetical protein D1007_05549 [Hordeum vulgare]|nr:hypothetical protein D1007_05549 [Hordeum vulgare]
MLAFYRIPTALLQNSYYCTTIREVQNKTKILHRLVVYIIPTRRPTSQKKKNKKESPRGPTYSCTRALTSRRGRLSLDLPPRHSHLVLALRRSGRHGSLAPVATHVAFRAFSHHGSPSLRICRIFLGRHICSTSPGLRLDASPS